MPVLTEKNGTSFKARPVPTKVLESAGDLGVPRVQKKAPTQPKEFNLSSRPTSARRAAEPSWQQEAPLYSSFTKAKATAAKQPSAVPRAASSSGKVGSERRPTHAPAPVPSSKPAPAPVTPADAVPIAPVVAISDTETPSEAAVVMSAPAVESIASATGAVSVAPAPLSAAAAAVLTISEIELIQAECFADDVTFDYEVVKHWSEPQLRTFFEAGGQEPPAAGAAEPEAAVPVQGAAHQAPPASPSHVIRADEMSTPDTVEFHA